MQVKPIKPGPGQESCWDYPRPPALEQSNELVEVVLGGVVIASTRAAWRVMETSHPPTYYLPETAFLDGSVRAAQGSSFCEWKGRASYFDLLGGDAIAPAVAWGYPDPNPRFKPIRNHLAVMPALVEECRVNGETVKAQEGGFYGGWITSRVVGPFKGPAGTGGW